MPPKQPSKQQQQHRKAGASASSASKSKDVANEELQQDPIQAVILSDAFNKRLAPLTTHRPACLLPLCNVALLDWTLESLALAGVDEIFILATQFTDQIKHHISDTKFGAPNITVIATPHAQSIGDVMRELDSKQVIRSDFILVHGHSVTSIDLSSVVAAHKRRRKKDKDAIMTICTMPSGKHSRTRAPGDNSLFFLQPTTSQLLHYASLKAVPRLKSTSLPLELFDNDAAATLNGASKGAEIDIRNDLVDSGIDICSVDVPPLFSENFDYQTLRRDFVLGILTSDLLDSKIFVHVAPNGPPASGFSASSSSTPAVIGTSTYGRGYAARVNSPAAYDAISRDVISKWTHPLAPSGYLPGGQRYSSRPGLRFVGDSVVLSRTCTIGHASVLGSGSHVGDQARVDESVIGPAVLVGTRSTISGSYIWADAKIGEGCIIERSIIGERVQILDGVRIGKGSIVAPDCVIGPNVELKPFSRVGMTRYGEEEEEEEEDEEDDDNDDFGSDTEDGGDSTPPGATSSSKVRAFSNELGTQAIGYLWPALGEKPHRQGEEDQYSDDDSEDEIDEIEQSANARVMRLAADLDEVEFSDSLSDISSVGPVGFSSTEGEDSDEDGTLTTDEDADSDENGAGLMSSTMLTVQDGQTDLEKAAAEERLNEFRDEAQASLERAFEEGHTIDNAAIELKTLRMASNVPLSEVRKIVIAFVLRKCDPDKPREMIAVLDRWGGLIQTVAQDDQIEALGIVQAFCATDAKYFKLFVPLLKKFYNDDVVSDESIVNWWRHPVSRRTTEEAGGEKGLALRKAAEEVVRYILESEESSEEEEEDDE